MMPGDRLTLALVATICAAGTAALCAYAYWWLAPFIAAPDCIAWHSAIREDAS